MVQVINSWVTSTDTCFLENFSQLLININLSACLHLNYIQFIIHCQLIYIRVHLFQNKILGLNVYQKDVITLPILGTGKFKF